MKPWWHLLSWVISAAWLEESIPDPLDLPEWLVPSLGLLLGTGRWMLWTLALLFPVAVWVLPVPWGALCSCCACILSLMCHLHWGLHCPSLPGQLCCFALLWACPQILLELRLLEQTSHSCCLWQLSSAQLYSPVPCSACSLQALGPGFWVWFVSVWCSGAGSGSGEAVVGFGDHLGKAARDE